MILLAWPVSFATRVARLIRAIIIRLVWFAKRVAGGAWLFARILIRLWAGRPSLGATAPRWAIRGVRLAALAALLLYAAFFGGVAPPVIEAVRGADPWTREGMVVLLLLVWLGGDALRYCRLAIRPGGAAAAQGTQSQAYQPRWRHAVPGWHR
jgi:hypothetical protein